MKRPWRWAGVAVLLVLCGAGTLAWRAGLGNAPPSPSAALASSAPVLAAAPTTPIAAWVRAPAEVAMAASPARSGSQPDKASGELCGIDKMSGVDMREGAPVPAWVEALNRQHQQARDNVLARLDGGTLSQRVTAAVLRDDIQTAAQLAAGSGDALAYGMALRVCRQNLALRVGSASRRAWLAASAASGELASPEAMTMAEEPTACAMLSIEKLEALAPTDGAAPLFRLSDAVARSDRAGVSQALFQVVQRPRLQGRPRPFSAAMLEVLGAEPTASEVMFLSEALGKDAVTVADGSAATVARTCSAQALKDANVRQLCEQAARRMPDMVTDLLDARMLHRLEDRLGLPHSSKSLSEQDMKLAVDAMNAESVRWLEKPGCASFSKLGQHVMALTREGELAQIRRLVKQLPASAPHR